MKLPGRTKIYSCLVLAYIPLIFALLPLGGCVTGGNVKEVKTVEPVKSDKGELKEIIAEPVENGKNRVTIESTASIQYTAFKLQNPLRLVLDLNDTGTGILKKLIKVNQGSIEGIKIQNFAKTQITRVEILLNRPIAHEIIRPSYNILQVLISDKADKTKKITKKIDEADKKESKQKKNIETTKINNVDIIKIPDGKYRIIIKTAGATPKFIIFKRNDLKRLILEIENAAVSSAAEKEINITDSAMPMKKIRSYQHKKEPFQIARVVIDLTRLIAYNVYRDKGDLLVDIGEALKKPELKETKTPSPAPVASSVSHKEKEQMPEAHRKEIADKKKKEKRTKKYSTKTVSIDLQDADITDVLKLIADVSNMNIITSGEISYKITMRLIDVPWYQALDVILKTAKLGMIREGNIIRIAPITVIAAEKKALADQKIAKAAMNSTAENLEELFTKIIPINYAKASDLISNLSKIKSERGDISIDARTNSLIILDTKKNIARMKNLIDALDKRTPQVLIEARIVEVNRNYSKDLGIEWGGGISSTSSNSFPSTIDMVGSSVGTNVVNLPAAAGAGSGGAVSATLGSVAGTAALDIRLSALESEGKARILSTPKIVTSDNTSASIESGKSIPYATVSSSGTAVQFVNATIGLRVTPHITSDGYVSLLIDATKNEADFGNQVQGTPSIITKSAKTEVLLKDGDTTVIGGLYKTTSSTSSAGVPWFSRIPILGWFFQKKTDSDIGEELLIFITATIIR